MLPPGGIPLSRRVYLPEYEFSMDFASEYVKQLRTPQKAQNACESSLSSVMSQKTLNKLKQLEKKRRTQEGNVGNIEDATQLQKAKNIEKTKKLYNSKDNVATRCGA